MPFLLSPNFQLEEVTRDDLAIASLAWGFTLGFGWLTTWAAIKQTARIWKRYGKRSIHNTYIWLIWLEILVCLIFSIICWLYLRGDIKPSFAFYFSILTCWALQVQFLLQIIINRCALLIPSRRTVWQLKFWVAFLITLVNISVYNIWVPARLQISHEYIWINEWWDRCEKVIYLFVDGALNIYFILIVKKHLISNGLTKYKRLTNFNIFIICFSLSMDVLIISMMSLQNTFVYMQFHPLAYMVKLKIEMSMAELIAKVARKKERLPTIHTSQSRRFASLSSPLRSFTRSGNRPVQPLPPARNAVPFRVWNGSVPSGMDFHYGNGYGNGYGSGSARPTPLHSALASTQGSVAKGGCCTSPTTSVLEVPSGSNDLYMVQEVTVESEVVETGRHSSTVGASFMMPPPALPAGGRRRPSPPNLDYHHDDATNRNHNEEDEGVIILPVLPDGRLPPPDNTTPPMTNSDDNSYMGEVEPPVIWDGNPMISTVVATGLAR